MPSRTWTVRPAVVADRSQIIDLFEAVFGRRVSETYHDWKFQDSPSGPGIVMVAVHASRVVGQYALQPTPLRLGSDRILGAQSLDTMTHPDYRGQGMFTVLAQAAIDEAVRRGVEALYGFPNASSYPGFVRRLNWDHCGDVVRWARPLSGAALGRASRVLGPFADLAVRLLPTRAHGATQLEVGPVAIASAELQSLLKPSDDPKAADCQVDWIPEWAQWRLAPAAGRNYRWVLARREGRLVAAVAWGRRSASEAVLSIVAGSDPEAVRQCVGTAVAEARACGFVILETVAVDPSYIRLLRACGFLRRNTIPFIVRTMTARTLGGNIHQFSAWRIMPADLDTF